MDKRKMRTFIPVIGTIVLTLTPSGLVDADSSNTAGATTGNAAASTSRTSGTSANSISALTWIGYDALSPQSGMQNAAMVYDPDEHYVFMYGGLSSSQLNSVDLYIGWDWSSYRPDGNERTPFTNIGFYTGAYDPLTRNVVLFGDGNADAISDYGTSNTTLIWTGQRWRPVSPLKSPSSRAGAVMAYDAATKQMILFGGLQKTSSGWRDLNDTWLWNGTTWKQLKPKQSPPPRSFAGMTYDAKLKKLVLFGGRKTKGTTPALNDLWTWNGKTWMKLTERTPPAPRADACFVYDPKLGDIVLFGGNTLTSSGTLAPSNDTWLWNGSSWTELHPTVSPPARYGAAMAYDEDTGRLLMYGGISDPNQNTEMPVDNKTWVFDLPYSPPPTTSQISVSADGSFPPTTDDIVKVTGLQSGDAVKVYSATGVPLARTTKTSAATVSTNDVTASVYVPNMISGGYLLITDTQSGFSESMPVGIQVPQFRSFPAINIKVVNNDAGTPDTVTVTGQTSGDIIKVYADAKGKTRLGSTTADSNGTAVLSIPQLSVGPGAVYVSATSGNLAESEFMKANYSAEVTPTPPSENAVATLVDSTHKTDIVLFKNLEAGDIVKIYSVQTGGKPIAQGTELTSNHTHTGYTMVVIPQSAVTPTLYFSVTDPHRNESTRVAFTIKS